MIRSDSLPEFQRQQAFLLCIEQDDFYNRAVFGVADIGMPALRDFAHDGFVSHADLQDVVVFEVGGFHKRILLLRPSVFQARDFVEHDFPIFVIHPIGDKVAMPLKLEFVVGLGLREAGFDVGGDGL